MKKRLIAKSLIGLVVGALFAHVITLMVNYFSCGQFLVCMPELTERFGFTGAIIVQTILGGIFGMIALGGTCFFDIEKWSLLRASMAHCALILVTYIVIGLLLHWFSFHIIPILIMTGIIIFVYALIWLIMYAVWKREIKELNRLAEEYKKDTDTSGN
ncbi:MAG TPA: DUF3021 domain-containing protein [Clostridiaceae bacterium]|nr:DUF3021 domain-containing protein [Clostridiaceae bacterium]